MTGKTVSGGVDVSSLILSTKTTPARISNCSIIDISRRLADLEFIGSITADEQSLSSPSKSPSLSSSIPLSQPSSYSSSANVSTWANNNFLLSINWSVDKFSRRSVISAISLSVIAKAWTGKSANDRAKVENNSFI